MRKRKQSQLQTCFRFLSNLCSHTLLHGILGVMGTFLQSVSCLMLPQAHFTTALLVHWSAGRHLAGGWHARGHAWPQSICRGQGWLPFRSDTLSSSYADVQTLRKTWIGKKTNPDCLCKLQLIFYFDLFY